ncbi:MAG: TIGR00282 family metallophosphoesterase [Acetanaerobacterium sp.]
MRLLCVGDVIGRIGCDYLLRHLPTLKRTWKTDAVIVNGENSSQRNGISPRSAQRLFDAGADVITTGNHVFRHRDIGAYLEEHPDVLRPANYPAGTFGSGVFVLDLGKTRITVINLMGVVFMSNLKNPFEYMDELLTQVDTKLVVVDFHAEATSEKLALAHYLDGRISAMFGTHTHVQTADACILPKGTGYITDAGMSGPIHSVLGMKSELAIRRLKTLMPSGFEPATGDCMICAVLFEIDEQTGKTTSVTPIRFAENQN